ncbi:MAG TPA: pantoate--beta-alanine ligase, partial [Solirubrobacteraceae bacterium]|nr:pantoate--beta-alanine ligase [Solirubrobacteraceae bacterium]
TVREPDGLAMSSRNAQLGPEERTRALALSAALAAAGAAVSSGQRSADVLTETAHAAMSAFDVQPEYIALVSPETLEPVMHLDEPGLLAVAARLGSTRLIDNVTLDPSISDPRSDIPAVRPNSRQANPREANIACSA